MLRELIDTVFIYLSDARPMVKHILRVVSYNNVKIGLLFLILRSQT